MSIQKDSRWSWLYLFVTLLMMLTVQSFQASNGVFVAILIQEFNETNARAGWIVSMVLFLMYVLCPLVIHIHQSVGFRWSMAIACFLYVFAFLASAFVPSLNYLYFTYSIPFGISLCFVAQLTIRTQREYFHKFYGLALGARFSSISVGAVLISFFFPIIYGHIGFNGAMLSALSFTPFFFIYGLVSRTHVGTERPHFSYNILQKLKIFQELCQDKSFALCLAGTTIFYFTTLVPIIFMVRYGVTLGYPLSKAKWLLMTRNITSLPTRIIVGYLSDIAFRRRKIKLIVQCTYPIFGLLSLLCSFVRSFPLLVLYMALNGVIEGVFWVTLSLYIDEITSGYHCDEAFSLLCFLAAFAVLIGPPAIGWLFDKTGEFRYVFYTIFVVSLLATFLLVLSSCVKVDKQFSLHEKGLNREVILESSETTKHDKIVYETSI